MTPKYVVYECENCGKLFYREVAATFKDDGAECHVSVQLLHEQESESMEEFPMCVCIGGNAAHTIELSEAEEETPIAE